MEDRATGDDLVCFMIPHLSAVIVHQVFYQSLFTSFILMTCSVDILHQSLFICHSSANYSNMKHVILTKLE